MPGRHTLSRSFGEYSGFGIFCRLSEEHIIAFLMATHRRLGRQEQAKFLADAHRKHSTKRMCPFLLVHRFDNALLYMILEMACRPKLDKAYEKLPAVRALLGEDESSMVLVPQISA